MIKIELICSNCGQKEETADDMDSVFATAVKGWRATPGAMYCPECVRTWKDRNGTEMPTNWVNTIRAIGNHILQERKRGRENDSGSEENS
jgi:hypothetical protein